MGHIDMRRTAQHGLSSPLSLRLWALALANVNRDGHAEFSTGELADNLAYVDKGTGELRQYGDRRIRKAIAALVEDGWLKDGSSVRCLWVPWAWVQRGTGRTGCKIHKDKATRSSLIPPDEEAV